MGNSVLNSSILFLDLAINATNKISPSDLHRHISAGKGVTKCGSTLKNDHKHVIMGFHVSGDPVSSTSLLIVLLLLYQKEWKRFWVSQFLGAQLRIPCRGLVFRNCWVPASVNQAILRCLKLAPKITSHFLKSRPVTIEPFFKVWSWLTGLTDDFWDLSIFITQLNFRSACLRYLICWSTKRGESSLDRKGCS